MRDVRYAIPAFAEASAGKHDTRCANLWLYCYSLFAIRSSFLVLCYSFIVVRHSASHSKAGSPPKSSHSATQDLHLSKFSFGTIWHCPPIVSQTAYWRQKSPSWYISVHISGTFVPQLISSPWQFSRPHFSSLGGAGSFTSAVDVGAPGSGVRGGRTLNPPVGGTAVLSLGCPADLNWQPDKNNPDSKMMISSFLDINE